MSFAKDYCGGRGLAVRPPLLAAPLELDEPEVDEPEEPDVLDDPEPDELDDPPLDRSPPPELLELPGLYPPPFTSVPWGVSSPRTTTIGAPEYP